MSYTVPPTASASFSSSVSQSVASTTASQPVVFDTTEFAKGITLVTSGGKASRITVGTAGNYFFSFSAVCSASSGSNHSINLWLAKNGTNIARSNTPTAISQSGYGYPCTVTFILSLAANDYIEIMMSGDSTNDLLLAVAATAGPPAVPACPSIIATINKVSA